LVTNERAIRSEAALAGGMTRLSRPTETVWQSDPDHAAHEARDQEGELGESERDGFDAKHCAM
jgi:hypothetical protein